MLASSEQVVVSIMRACALAVRKGSTNPVLVTGKQHAAHAPAARRVKFAKAAGAKVPDLACPARLAFGRQRVPMQVVGTHAYLASRVQRAQCWLAVGTRALVCAKHVRLASARLASVRGTTRVRLRSPAHRASTGLVQRCTLMARARAAPRASTSWTPEDGIRHASRAPLVDRAPIAQVVVAALAVAAPAVPLASTRPVSTLANATGAIHAQLVMRCHPLGSAE